VIDRARRLEMRTAFTVDLCAVCTYTQVKKRGIQSEKDRPAKSVREREECVRETRKRATATN
jgi:hypothetical protein